MSAKKSTGQKMLRSISKRLCSLNMWIKEWMIALWFGMTRNAKLILVAKSYKTDNHLPSYFNVFCYVGYFSIVKIPLEFLIARWDTVSWRLNTLHITSTWLLLGAFLIWNKIPLFSTAQPLPWWVLSLLKQVSTQSSNCVFKKIFSWHIQVLFIVEILL